MDQERPSGGEGPIREGDKSKPFVPIKRKGLKVFVCTDHDGKWPVPVASMVIARDKRRARAILNKKLKEAGLNPKVTSSRKGHYTLKEIPLEEGAHILSDGEY